VPSCASYIQSDSSLKMFLKDKKLKIALQLGNGAEGMVGLTPASQIAADSMRFPIIQHDKKPLIPIA